MGRRLTAPGNTPDTAYAIVPGLPEPAAHRLAVWARNSAAARAPKLSGVSSSRLRPFWGAGFFGIRWSDPRVWYQESGTKGRVMRELAGKTIPMWLDDPTGELRRENPKAKTRVAADGRRQVLIFRRAAKIGQRKFVRRRVRGTDRAVDVPASYPGAPGRIGARGPGGRMAGGRGTGGVRWRHPGLRPKGFIHQAISDAARLARLGSPRVHVASSGEE